MSLKSTLSGVVLALSFASIASADIVVHDAYARSSNAMAGAAFMVIHNTGDTDDRLVDVRSNAAARTQLHTHRETDEGLMQMVHLEDGLDLPAGSEILLQRGADHVMFMGLSGPFEDGEMISITLVFEDAGDVVVDITVDQTRTPTGSMDHDTMDHDDEDHDDMDHGNNDHDSGD